MAYADRDFAISYFDLLSGLNEGFLFYFVILGTTKNLFNSINSNKKYKYE